MAYYDTGFSQIAIGGKSAMRDRRLKRSVTSWDIFDTLVCRFTVDPVSVFEMIEQRCGLSDFVTRRVAAQTALDKIGDPYDLFDIYQKMAESGVHPLQASSLLVNELSLEREHMIPVARNLARVKSSDILISDMYLTSLQISDLLFEVCGLNLHRPVVRSNWGKASASIWPVILANYTVRKHVGDNMHSDFNVPRRFNIRCELVQDANLTNWETRLIDFGLRRLALVQREARLRCIPLNDTPFHNAVVGPFLTLLTCFAAHIVNQVGDEPDFAFLSRSSNDLSRIFSTLFPHIRSKNLNISRNLAQQGRLDDILMSSIRPSTILVDMLATGRSFFKFADRNGAPGRCFIVLGFLENLVQSEDRLQVEKNIASGRLQTVFKIVGDQCPHWHLEHLLQSPYPAVTDMQLDLSSGGVIESFAPDELGDDEMSLIGWKVGVISEFIRTLRVRGLGELNSSGVYEALSHAMSCIIATPEIMAPFSSFAAQEIAGDWA